ncbi:MAG TPA: glycoside hydrolase family 44 protein [Candidatus Binatia bacterium]
MASAVAAAADVIVYDDALQNGFDDSWSWGSQTHNVSSASPVHSGSDATLTTFTGGWSGLQVGNAAGVDVSADDTLRFFIHGGASGGQNILVRVGNNDAYVEVPVTPVANTWTQVDVPITDLGSPRSVTFVYWFNNTAGAQPSFSVDDVRFVNTGVPPPPPGSGPALTVNAASGQRAIDPDIYGMNFADEALASELALPVRRWGGNSTTRYNWQLDTSNHAFDWYFENIPNDNAHPELLPDGSETDNFVEQDRRTSTHTLLTMPLIGWTPKTRAYACGFSVAKYGAQQSVDPYRNDCGNGVASGGADVTGNDPTDTSLAITPSFVSDWIAHLTSKYGSASGGGVAFYDLDNEPMLWNSTHRDAHPSPTSYDEMRDRTWQYAAAIKQADAGAKTLGPAEWGWTGYFWSALDEAAGGDWWNHPADRNAHGGTEFVAWYLQQMKAYDDAHATRILDYLDLHFYPQESGVSLSPAGGSSTQALRLRSTRSLWDPTYTDESWIGDTIRMIPRMKDWVNANYPGTKIAISEYNWGALNHVNGAVAEADVLGIFGREGLDLATLWDPPTSTQPGAYAFRMYRNYDGAGSQFGDTHVDAASADQSKLSIYASLRTGDGALTIMVVNKDTASLDTSIVLSGYSGATTAKWYLYSGANLTKIVPQGDLPIASNAIAATFPAASISLLVLGGAPSGGGSNCASTPRNDCDSASARGSKLKLRWDSLAGKGGMVWKWAGGATPAFGNPTAGDAYDVCLYAGAALQSDAALPSSASCGLASCWTTRSSGYVYKNPTLAPDGISKALLATGSSSRVSIKAGGTSMPDPGLPLTVPVVLQLVRSDGSACWAATYSSAAASTGVSFAATSD